MKKHYVIRVTYQRSHDYVRVTREVMVEADNRADALRKVSEMIQKSTFNEIDENLVDVLELPRL